MISDKKKQQERTRNRWLLLFYDSMILLLVWLAVFVWTSSGTESFSWLQGALNFVLAYGSFFAFRMLFHVYRQIWRAATILTFTREMAAGLAAGVVYVLLSLLTAFPGAQFVTLLAFIFCYMTCCILSRIVYYYLYRLTKLEGGLFDVLKRIFVVLTLVDINSPESEGALLHVVLEPTKSQGDPINHIQRVVDQFAIRGTVKNITQIKKGYINQTYHIETISENGHAHHYTLQRINTNVFPDVDALMDNFKLTTNHLHGRYHLPGHKQQGSVQTLRPTKDGRSYLRDDTGCWRMLSYIDDVYSLNIPDSPDTFYHAGCAFGKFVKEMADVEISSIKEVIPNFHDTRSRYLDLERVIAKDPKQRAASVANEIAFVRARSKCYGMITDALEYGIIPTRICHNDCNLNNILFDNTTHLPVAVIDLDTVMPSSPLYDYGDSMRIGTNTATDDEKDLSKVSCDLRLYERYARGYLEEFGRMMTKAELELLPFASLIITAEDGIRFLMDHIDGDTYYNIYYPNQNLDRARTQLKLLEDMEKKLPDIVDILQTIYADLKLDVKLDREKTAKKWKENVTCE